MSGSCSPILYLFISLFVKYYFKFCLTRNSFYFIQLRKSLMKSILYFTCDRFFHYKLNSTLFCYTFKVRLFPHSWFRSFLLVLTQQVVCIYPSLLTPCYFKPLLSLSTPTSPSDPVLTILKHPISYLKYKIRPTYLHKVRHFLVLD